MERKIKRIGIITLSVLIFTFIVFKVNSSDDHPREASADPSHSKVLEVEPDWPSDVSASAIGAKGYGVLAMDGDTNKRPIASIAKVITSLVLLDKYPLQSMEDGPQIEISEEDEQLYRDYVEKNGTVVLIKSGVSITLRDAIEAMLLPSANNVADTAAIWGFGSLEEYSKYANNWLKEKGLNDTEVGDDASGLAPSTQSTTSDLIKLGEIALDNPVVSEIMASDKAEVPIAGVIPNYNKLVTDYGFSGIKPGDTLEAGITTLFSKKENIDGEEVVLIGAVLGADSYRQCNDSAIQIVESVKASAVKVEK